MESSDAAIPRDLLQKCEGIVIFPRTLNIAWGIGGQYGRGVALRHDRETGRWSPPAFYMLGGLTIGPQIGGQAIDVMLLVMNEKGLNSLLQSKCTLGGDAGIALGPAGRNATASTDLGLKAEIYSYSRAKGLYIGLSLKGAVVKPDKDANRMYYGADVAAREILLEKSGRLKKTGGRLTELLREYAPPPEKNRRWLAVGLGLAVAAGALFFVVRRVFR